MEKKKITLSNKPLSHTHRQITMMSFLVIFFFFFKHRRSKGTKKQTKQKGEKSEPCFKLEMLVCPQFIIVVGIILATQFDDKISSSDKHTVREKYEASHKWVVVCF